MRSQAVFSYAGRLLGLLPSQVPSDTHQPYLEVQLQRLELVKRLLLSLQIAAYLQDEMLMQEGRQSLLLQETEQCTS